MSFRFQVLLFSVVLVTAIFGRPVDSAAAPLKCSSITTQIGRDSLTNSCDSCRIVIIERNRPGAEAPISRTVTIPSKSKVTLSFRGPGQSRITSDTPCKPDAAGQSVAPNTAQNDGLKCIQLQRSDNNGLALVNTCGQCRMAVVERLDGKGGKHMQNVGIDAHKEISLPSMGAAYARILTEKTCK